jgi:hypothetical protein
VTTDSDSPTAAFVEAAGAHDVPAVVALTTPDVVLRSPITTSFVFRGQEQLSRLLTDVFEVLPDQRYTGDVGDSRSRAIRGTATIHGMELNEVILAQVDEAGLVSSMELFMRPMPAVVALASELGPRMARRRGRVQGLAATAMLKPLAAMVRRGEGTGARLARPR